MIYHILVFFFVAALTLQAQEASSCIKCHPQEGAQEADGAHFKNKVTCNGCHGGDEALADKEKSKASATGYSGKLTPQEIPRMCSRCHSDVEMMNPYGIQTDQYAQYLTSGHGSALYKKGNTDVATCVSCHGVHGIKPAHNRDSPVYPKNVPATCGKCHSDKDLMEKHGLRSDIERLYKQGMHAQLLFERDDLSAPTCATCHGNHGAVPPGFAQVGAVCGKCHIKQKEHFDLSPHAPLVEKGEFDTCVTCHSNHKVMKASDKLFETSCRKCHENGKPIEYRNTLLALISSTRQEYEKTKERLKAAQYKGVIVDEEQLLLEEGKTSLLQMEPIQHTLEIPRVYTLAEQAKRAFADVSKLLDDKEQGEQMKRLAILPVVVFLLLMSLGFWIKQNQYTKAKKGEG